MSHPNYLLRKRRSPPVTHRCWIPNRLTPCTVPRTPHGRQSTLGCSNCALYLSRPRSTAFMIAVFCDPLRSARPAYTSICRTISALVDASSVAHIMHHYACALFPPHIAVGPSYNVKENYAGAGDGSRAYVVRQKRTLRRDYLGHEFLQ
jgi:hypothetical protein